MNKFINSLFLTFEIIERMMKLKNIELNSEVLYHERLRLIGYLDKLLRGEY